jgi:hypothetical protein
MSGRTGIENDGARNGAYHQPPNISPPDALARQAHARPEHSSQAPALSALSLDEVYRLLRAPSRRHASTPPTP